MQVAVRPYVTAGVALVGASVLAVSPVAPPVPEAKLPATSTISAASHLTAATNPIVALTELFNNTVGSASGLTEQFLASPAPILGQLVTNQLANLTFVGNTIEQIVELLPGLATQLQSNFEQIGQQLAAGDLVGAGQTLNNTLIIAGVPLLGVIAPPLGILQNTTQNIANVFAAIPQNVFPLLMGVVGPLNSFNNAVFDIGQTIMDSVSAGDFLGALGAVVSAPIVIADAILNGYGIGGAPGGVGLLTPFAGFSGGPIGALLHLRDVIADALVPIGPDGPQAAAGLPDPNAQLLSLNVDAGEEDSEAPAAKASYSAAATDEPVDTGEVDDGVGEESLLGEGSDGTDDAAAVEEVDEVDEVEETEEVEESDLVDETEGAGEEQATSGTGGEEQGGESGDDGPTTADGSDDGGDGSDDGGEGSDGGDGGGSEE